MILLTSFPAVALRTHPGSNSDEEAVEQSKTLYFSLQLPSNISDLVSVQIRYKLNIIENNSHKFKILK